MWKTGLLLLFWGLLTSSELQQEATEPEPRNQPPSGKLDFGYVPQGDYKTLAYYEPGVIGILFHMVHAFLYVVQPNPFPEDLVVKVAKDKFGAIQSEYQKVSLFVYTLYAIYYETGFMVCAVLGLLFIVLLPLVGLFFCLCRCCENCGGEMHQRQRKNADCQRGLLTTLLFATSLIITAGVLCAYAANQNLSSQLEGMKRLVSSNLEDLQTFANETPTQIDYLIAQYATAKYTVISDLDNVGPLLGGNIHVELGTEVHPALDGVLRMAGAMRETKEALENVSVSLEVLQEATGKLHFNLSLVRSSLNRTLNDPGCSGEDSDATTTQLCRSIHSSLAQLHVSANFTRLPDVNNQLESVNQVLKTDLSDIIQKGFSSFNDTPGMVSDQMRDVVEGARGLLDVISTNISSFSKVFPVHSSLANFTNFIIHTQSKIEDSYPEIDQIDFYRWICCTGLCCMVVLILAFNFLAILCGTMGYDKHASPTTRGCVSNTGGTLLMAGVGFSFLFSWILMGVVTATFLVGGNVEKLVCEPFHTKELFKVLDTPHLVNPEWRNFIPGYMYNDSDLDLTPKGPLQTSLKGHTNSLRQIHSQLVIPMEQAMVINYLQSFFFRLTSMPGPISTIEAAQYLISQNATHVAIQETEKYKQTIVGYFRQYIEWVRTSVSICVPTNTFWFGLGCCALFLLPSIILSVKLAKFYRRMDTEDVYDE
uniref:Prominin 1a n=1 Tax=Oncorhynchus kisutch TaxID=8019 RepID=A0A8C7GNB3_ONCKI